MAAFVDALDLKTAVGDLVSNRSLSDVWPRLVAQAETQLNQVLRTVWQVTDTTLTFTDGEATLPTDFLEMAAVYGPCGHPLRSGLPGDSKRPGTSYSTYSVTSGKVLIRGFSGDRDISYYAALPTLANSLSDTNWLLTQAGDAYLYGVGLQAARFLKDVDLIKATGDLLTEAVKLLKTEDERHRWANGVVRIAQCP